MMFPSSLTVTAVKQSSIKNITGVCVNNAEFMTMLNEAVSRLMTYGNWFSTVVKGRVCVYNMCITWPRWTGTVLSTNIRGRNVQIQNKWYDFMPLSAGDCTGLFRNGLGFCGSSNVTTVDDGITPVFQNVPCGTPSYIRAYARTQGDLGKTVTVYGTDEFGQELMVRDNQSGVWSIGEVLTLAPPFAQTSKKLRQVTRISKDITIAPVDVYGYDDTLDILREMGHYEPSETEPRYRFTSVRGRAFARCCNGSGTLQQQIEFLAKMQHIPCVLDTDIVQIDNIEAIKLMISAGRLAEAGDDQGASVKQALAIKELNRQMNDKFPLNQIPILLRPEGTAEPRLAGIGQMM